MSPRMSPISSTTGNWKKAWGAIVDIIRSAFQGVVQFVVGIINSIIDALNKVISWFNGNKNTIAKIGQSSGASTTAPKSLPTVGKASVHTLAASGAVISNGATIVGEAGPELLTMNGGVATVQPISNTTNMGGITMSVYGAPGQSANEIAEVVMNKIQNAVNTRGAVWA